MFAGVILLRYESVVCFVLRGSMGRQESSDSLPLSWKIIFCGTRLLLVNFSVSISALSPDETFPIRSREAFGPLRGDGGWEGIAFSSNQLLR